MYFSARREPDGIGSRDLKAALTELDRFTRARDPKDLSDVQFMLEVANRRFMQLLYARLLIFSEFLQIASEQPGGITDKHKGRWLLLQVAPETLAGSDIFIEIYIASNAAKFTDLQAHCHDLLVKIERLINCRPVCVIDEAQIPLRSLHGWFRSSEDQPRSLRIIVSGTGVSMRALEKVRTSTVAKEGGIKPRTILDLGAFDVEER